MPTFTGTLWTAAGGLTRLVQYYNTKNIKILEFAKYFQPNGAGIFKAGAVDYAPPQTGWVPLCKGVNIPKCVRTFRKISGH